MGPTPQYSASSRGKLEGIAEAVLPLQILDVRTRTRGALREIAAESRLGCPRKPGGRLQPQCYAMLVCARDGTNLGALRPKHH